MFDEFQFDTEKIVRNRFGVFCRFTGGGAGAAQAESKTEGKTAEQTKWLTEALKLYGPTLGQGEDIYPGQRVAGFDPLQAGALDQAGGYLDAFSAQRAQPLFSETGETLRATLAGETGAQFISPQQTADFFRSVYEQPARTAYAKEVLPATREAYAGPGFWSSDRARAQAEAGQGLFQYLGTKKGELDWSTLMANRATEEARAQRMLGAVPAGLAYGQVPTQEAQQRMAGLQDVFGMGGQAQAQQQAVINAAMQEFAEANRITSEEDLQTLLTLLGLSFQRGSSSSSSWNANIAFGSEGG